MRNGLLFFLGLFVALLFSWAGLVLAPHAQLGALTPFFDEGEGAAHPNRSPGVAARGQWVYADLGCAACHTQQVRRPDFGSDKARGWGDRQSVARDYIFQVRPQLGASRVGPDLANLAARKPAAPDAEGLLKLLYSGTATHPSYRFLFEEREVVGQRSSSALRLTGETAPAADHEIVPTERAQALVAYLLSLNQSYVYPEARPLEKKAEAGHGAAPAKTEDKGTPAALPEKKAEEKK